MWFKQIQLFQLVGSLRYSAEELSAALLPLAFRPCLPSIPTSSGWVPPVDDAEAPLVQEINGCIMICLQIEERILPAAVIRQELAEKVKQLEATHDRKLRSKEKNALKDEVIMTLLPRSFTKLSRIYAYLDTKNHWLVLGTSNDKKTEQFLGILKKCISEEVHPFDIKKLRPLMTQWLKHQSYPQTFTIEKSCVLQDANQKTRIIRCQQQDLFATSVQGFIKDGCEVKRLALLWQDSIHFALLDDFTLQSMKFEDQLLTQAADLEAETKQQQFNADFLIMTQTLSSLLKNLLDLFINAVETEPEKIIS